MAKSALPAAGVRWLTGQAARERAHQDRAWVDAIMVGSGTVIADNPGAHRPAAEAIPQRINRYESSSMGAGSFPRMRVSSGRAASSRPHSRDREFRDRVTSTGATVLEIEHTAEGLVLPQLLRILAQRGIVSLIAEGGPTRPPVLVRRRARG